MKRKLLKYSIATVLLATTIQATPTFASPVESPVTQGQINATQEQIIDTETMIQQLDDSITIAMEKSKKLNEQIKTQQEKIKETEAEIETGKESLDAHKKIYSDRLKAIQTEGNQPVAMYADLLFSSDNISEFLTRFTAITRIIESDTDLLNTLNEKNQALLDAEEKLQTELGKLTENQDELASEQKKIEEDKKTVAKELEGMKNKLKSQEAQLAQQEAERLAQLELARLAAQETEGQAKSTQQSSEQDSNQPQSNQEPSNQQPSNQQSSVNKVQKVKPAVEAAVSTNSGDASALIATAKQYLGVPYVWGGSTPSGFDCSGFTSYVFRSVGVSLPRVSRDQQNVGTRIPVDQVQPGDLVFNGSPAYHVGIYIGNGQYIHAPQTGDVVKIASYNPSRFSSASRVLR